MGAMGKSTHSYLLKSADGGTSVTWRMNADFGMNPVGRVFGLFLEKMLGPTMERGLANLDRVVTNAA
jgi:carbon monoxide dehydrogenase subunit G